MQSSEAIAQCRDYLAADQFDNARDLARTLENEHPVSQFEWRALHDLFIELKDLSWAEIITSRFLASHPDNVSALIEDCAITSHFPVQRSKEITEKLKYIESLGLTTSREYFKVATLYQKIGLGHRAVIYFSQAASLAPDDTEIIVSGIRNLIELGRSSEVREILKSLYQVQGNDRGILILVMNFGARIAYRDLTACVIEKLFEASGSDNSLKLLLATRAADIKRDDIVLKVWQGIDIQKVHHAASLTVLQQALAGRGLIDVERKLIERALVLDSTNREILATSRSISQQFLDKFYRSSLGPVSLTSARSARAACLKSFRRLILRGK